MEPSELNRRDFNKLAMAAFGGILAGTMAGCGGEEAAEEAPPPSAGEGEAAATETAEAHVCRGLNACEGKGVGGDNACAGQGACATAEAHTCHTMNDCKGQGGCGEHPGQNDCKGMGECGVPLSDEAWAKAREQFEASMSEQGTSIGEAPAKS